MNIDCGGPQRWSVRFPAREGWHGWLAAGSQGIGFFGAGQIEITDAEVILRGTRRLWFLVPIQAELRLDRRELRDCVSVGDHCLLMQSRVGKRERIWTLIAADAEQAAAIAGRLGTAEHRAPDGSSWQRAGILQVQLEAHTPRVLVTPVLVAANVASFCLMAALGAGFIEVNPLILTELGSNFGAATLSGQWWRLLTSMFIHFGLLHLLLNMWVLWDIGRLVERLHGSARFLLIYIASGLAGGMFSTFWDPSRNSAGASGAIFGVLGAFLAVLFWRCNTIPLVVKLSYRLGIIAFLGFNLLAGAFSGGVDNAAHVGGLLAGLVLGAGFAPYRLDPVGEMSLPDPVPRPHIALPICALSAMAALGVLGSQSAAMRVPVANQYWVTHSWYAKGEAEVLATMGNLEMRMQSGTISPAEIAHTVRNDILPFWKSADERLLAEPDSDDELLSTFATFVADYTRLRRETFESMLDAATSQDAGTFADAQERYRQSVKAGFKLQDFGYRERAEYPPTVWRSSPALRRLAATVSSSLSRCKGDSARDRGRFDAAWARGDGPYEFAAAGCRAQRAFIGGDFEQLDRVLSATDAPARYRDGSWELSGWLFGLSEVLGEARDWEANLSRVHQWQQQFPQSRIPLLAEALLYKERGWNARGAGRQDTVSPAGWLLFEYALGGASNLLSRQELQGWTSPIKYKFALDLGTDTSASLGAQYALYDEAVAAFPDYLPLHRAMLRYLLPRWHGSIEDVDVLVAQAVAATRDRLGNEMYARLYSTLAEYEGPEFDLFGKSAARWDKMKVGFEEMLARYPQSLAVLNDYASFACRAEDYRTFTALKVRLGDRIYLNSWPEKHSPQDCTARARLATRPTAPQSPSSPT
jgi:rhomboid protease GluP